MELQGPRQFDDPFAKDILRFNRGGIVSARFYSFTDMLLMTFRLFLLVTNESHAFLLRRSGEMLPSITVDSASTNDYTLISSGLLRSYQPYSKT